ncbi:MAG: copper chaperone PCu(A)C [Rhodospirillaceae bacterium]|nr:copper chaperone PCu(A)C [Rhodospirillaceae bacterium]
MRTWHAALALVILMAGAGAWAQSSNDRSIEIDKAWARISPSEPDTLSIFFDVTSKGDVPDTLRFATSPIAGKVLLRRGRWEGLNFHNDQAIGVPIKAHRLTSFRPGVLEVTLKELNAPTIVGETVTVRLHFSRAGEITITPTISNQLLGNRFRKN